ncbi:MAG: hypothetical protein H7095_07845 [Pseudopedobacter sp.]|nr:hypothetical protein [Deinococcales bacterium]
MTNLRLGWGLQLERPTRVWDGLECSTVFQSKRAHSREPCALRPHSNPQLESIFCESSEQGVRQITAL